MYPKSACVSVIAAKADLDHGKWIKFVPAVGMSRQYAHRFMQIGENLNVHNCGHLPKAVATLYELSRLATEDIEHGIESGAITPDMKMAPTCPRVKIFPVDNGGKRNHNTRANNPTTLKSCGKCPCGRMWTTKTQGVERRNHTGVTLDTALRWGSNTTSSVHMPNVTKA